MVLDGDEVWPAGQLQETLREIETLPTNKNCVLSPFIFCVGDIYHYSTWGQYQTPWGQKGHFTLRFFRKVKGIHWEGSYDNDSLYYENKELVYTKENCMLSNYYFFHCGVLPRSKKDSDVTLGRRRPVTTFALGLFGHGKLLPVDAEIPKVFSLEPAKIVKQPQRLSSTASLVNLLAYLKDRL